MISFKFLRKGLMTFILLLFLFVLLQPEVYGQVPQGFNYQAVVRNGSGDLVVNAPVGVQISVLQGSASGTVVYSETHMPLSNANGLVTLVIGTGTALVGAFESIDWGAGPFFLETSLDPAGGANYGLNTTSQLLSVPFAMLAQDVVNDPLQVRSFVDSNSEASYSDLQPYVIELSSDWPTGESKEIPLQVIIDYCGDPDGCKLFINGELAPFSNPNRYRVTNSGYMTVNPDPATNYAYYTTNDIEPRAGNMGDGSVPFFTVAVSACRVTTRSWMGGVATNEPTTLHLVKTTPQVTTCTLRIED